MIEVETGVYNKNRRYGVEAGTRYVHAITYCSSNNSTKRRIATSDVIREASRQWQDKWGEIPWQNVDMTVTCTSAQVLVEFRVRPSSEKLCQNPECPKAGHCGGECARNF